MQIKYTANQDFGTNPNKSIAQNQSKRFDGHKRTRNLNDRNRLGSLVGIVNSDTLTQKGEMDELVNKSLLASDDDFNIKYIVNQTYDLNDSITMDILEKKAPRLLSKDHYFKSLKFVDLP